MHIYLYYLSLIAKVTCADSIVNKAEEVIKQKEIIVKEAKSKLFFVNKNSQKK